MPFGQPREVKRESGASPERSGHCKRGERLHMPLCKRHEKAQPDDDPQVGKPAENDWQMASEEGLMTVSLSVYLL